MTENYFYKINEKPKCILCSINIAYGIKKYTSYFCWSLNNIIIIKCRNRSAVNLQGKILPIKHVS